jgi:hypothetical protein
VPDELEARLAEQVTQVAPRARAEVVDRENLVPKVEKTPAEVRANEAGSSGNQDPRDALMPGERRLWCNP